MPRSAAIDTLSAAFRAAGASRDWEGLGALAHSLAPQLAALTNGGAWTEDELAALTRLRTAHEGAAAACGDALDTLAARLAEMRDNKDGWMAYALASDAQLAGHDE